MRSPKLLKLVGKTVNHGAVEKERKGRSQSQAAPRGAPHACVHVLPSGRWRPGFRARGPQARPLRSAYNPRRGHWDSQFNPSSHSYFLF